MSLLLLAPHLREQIHIALVGRHRVDRDRTQRREARFLEDGRRIALAEMASVGANMRREHPRLARLGAQLGDKRVGGAIAVQFAPGGALIAKNGFATEAFALTGYAP